MFVRALVLVLVAALTWAMLARRSDASSPRRTYVVRPADTLWSIAVSRYGGDPRDAVWRMRHENGLAGTTIRPGQRLVLP
jgi:hypothetical protein